MSSDYILLTGAGYSKNFGGWLASELWSVILSHKLVQQNHDLKNIIWEYRDRGFEEIFGDKRVKENQEYSQYFQEIVKDSFLEMHKAISNNFFRNFNQNGQIYEFIHKFSAFFTLNQDLFFEASHEIFTQGSPKYFYPHVKSRTYFQYGQPTHLVNSKTLELTSLMLDAALMHNAEPYNQLTTIIPESRKPLPYYKLHGSLNFRNGDKDILVIGGSKEEQIKDIPLIDQYHKDFEYSLKNAKRLMIIGYSFKDYHINQKIFDAVERYDLKFWIVDVGDLDSFMSNATFTESKAAKKIREDNMDFENKRMRKYNDLFRKGLISHTQKSLRSIFNENILEREIIESRFFE